MITMQDVHNALERYGWKYQQQDDYTLLTGFKGKARQFIVGLRLDSQWLTLTIVRYLQGVPIEHHASLYSELLMLNHRITFVRFALEESGDIILTADVPAERKFDYDLFATALDLLSFYADDVYPRFERYLSP